MPLGPIVPDSVGEQLAVIGEVGGSEGRWEPLRSLILRLGVLVPNDDRTLATIRRKRVVKRVESDTVHSVDICAILRFLLLAMALKTEVATLALVLHVVNIIIFDAAATLDGANRVALAVTKNADGRRCKLEGRVCDLLWVPIVALEVLWQVPDVDEAVLVRRHKQRPLAAHVVHWHGNVGFAHLLQLLPALLPRPEFDTAVPAT
uniref:Uncharacterized protein n=1 Tax=Favella ehrenbergii TaxID=182087 RepID=A0A7S3HZ21_9SPIT|mmetsp:Transcript_22454/g.27668  ORF Transcript_22454/g.27668 Transcript_22454/m.27668 type:complete len:205 (+) Transcript_22454:217-831(+)|eukprot:CAMPEP_0170464116 /NCGR_PEP_ID=MMETSP0123-20130129/8968_1 /TAXON_ID=182087 /ORGANISM="Favella ehrenbergii, Strain Fehren 1" /LENGTH=204 /DNA_ID=CAMNT_0010729707 /DNA_START=162 /DNA_END=776 /DNA_ORIENTATION=+